MSTWRALNFKLNKEILHELFNYCDGVLYWKIRPNNRIKEGSKAGAADNTGYIKIGIGGKVFCAHRLIYLMFYGWMPEEVDHKDLIRSNNRIENLRDATSAQNKRNAPVRNDNTSGIKGVSWLKSSSKWRVQVRHGKQCFSANFDDIELAELVAIEARNKFHGEFARHN